MCVYKVHVYAYNATHQCCMNLGKKDSAVCLENTSFLFAVYCVLCVYNSVYKNINKSLWKNVKTITEHFLFSNVHYFWVKKVALQLLIHNYHLHLCCSGFKIKSNLSLQEEKTGSHLTRILLLQLHLNVSTSRRTHDWLKGNFSNFMYFLLFFLSQSTISFIQLFHFELCVGILRVKCIVE